AASMPAIGVAHAAPPDADIAAFEAYSGARLVFSARALPTAAYYEIMPELAATRRRAAARIALREVKKYPKGYLGAIGLKAVGIFEALASPQGDGFRAFDESLGGYRYYGLWNGDNALVAAYYSDDQLPLTLHHEIFHHVDATRAGHTDFGSTFYADDARFERAITGKERYPALTLSAADLTALARLGGSVLRETVSSYAAKAPGEDQAETARHLMTSLPAALVQMARHPELPGSQRMLHVLHAYAGAAPSGPGVDWFVGVALGRPTSTPRASVARAAQSAYVSMQQRIQPRSSFRVWGLEDRSGVNWTLRRDLRGFGNTARALAIQGRAAGASSEVARANLGMLGLLARYQQFIAGRWSISAGTQQSFEWTRAQMLAALGDTAVRRRLERAAWAELAREITAAGELRARAADPLPSNRYAGKVDAAISDPAIRLAIRRVQPATVRLAGGSGVNLARSGLILTAAHVVDRLGAKGSVSFPDGRRLAATTIVFDARLDIALMKVDQTVDDLPVAALAARAPVAGSTAITIGQPGRFTPSGEETGYQPFHVSVGRIRGFVGDRLGPQGLGQTKHDAWTYWGHSGAPIFDASGRIIAMHNSWDSTTAMRHAVTWEALSHVLRRERLAPVLR
ncbi:MAG TPA: serine protease, partial [Kofleriaceae bacterium]|nr:serine protease [Kofleriaceae bacterium]